MAAGGRFLSCMLAVLSALLTPGYGEYRQIDLTSASGVSCNMSSIFGRANDESLDCRGALNGNTGMTYYPGGNSRYDQMRSARVFVDEEEIYQFPTFMVTTAQTITNLLPVSGQIIKLTRPGDYVTLCELQVYGCTFDSYGANCTQTCSTGCSENAGDSVCDSITGTCTRECASNRWGPNCSLPCGQCAGDGSCDVHTGYCTSGCLQEFEGDNCTLKLVSGEDDTQDGGNIAGPLVGGLLGAGALIGISVLLAAFMIIRWRRSRDTSNAADTDGAHFSSGDAPVRDVTEGDKPETETPGNESNYAPLEKYEDPNDIRPYSVLQDGDKLPKYLNIQSDQETAVYQNTTVSKN